MLCYCAPRENIHVVFGIPFFVFVCKSPDPPFGRAQNLGVCTKLVDLIFGTGYVTKISSVCVEKPIGFVKRCLEHWERIWYSLRDYPVVGCGYLGSINYEEGGREITRKYTRGSPWSISLRSVVSGTDVSSKPSSREAKTSIVGLRAVLWAGGARSFPNKSRSGKFSP